MLMTTSKPAALPFNNAGNTRRKSGSLGRCILAHSSAQSAHQSTPIEITPILSRPGVDEQGFLVEISPVESHSADIRDKCTGLIWRGRWVSFVVVVLLDSTSQGVSARGKCFDRGTNSAKRFDGVYSGESNAYRARR